MNIGRRRRARSARSTSPLPRIGSDEAVHDTTMSYSCSCSPSSRSSIACALKRCASGSARSSVRLATVMRAGPCAAKCVAHSSIISPAPMNSTFWSFRVGKMRAASFTAAAAMDTLVAPIRVVLRTSLATAKERWNSVQHAAERAGRLGGARRLLHLAEDLRLAEHHRIEPRGDAEGVAHRLLARQRVEVVLQLRGVHAVVVRQPLRQLGGRFVFLASRDIELGAVAGREDRGFARQPALQLAERLLQALDMEHHALAHRERRGLMVQAESEKRCSQGSRL